MANISLLTTDIDTYEGAELSTNNKSIIKAINELYVNQQILFATSTNLFKKLELTVGDLADDEELRTAYVKLEFSNIMDGLVKLNNALNSSLKNGTASTAAQINSIKEMIGDLDSNEELQLIFTTMGWNDVSDAVVKVNQRLSDYIASANVSANTVSVALRESITNLMSLIGTLDSDSSTKIDYVTTSFNDILSAIQELSTIIGYNTAAKEEFDQDKFESILDAVIDIYNISTKNTDMLNRFAENEATQAGVIAAKLEKFNDNLARIDYTVKDLVTGLTEIETKLQLQEDYLRTGFEGIAASLQKLSLGESNIIQLVGDLSSDIELKNKYDATGYTSMVDGICQLSEISNYMVNILGNVDDDVELLEAFAETSYDTVINAVVSINELLGNISTNNILKAAFVRLGFKNVAEGLVQLSDSLNGQLTTINMVRSELIAHEVDLDAHENLIPTFLMHFANREYVKGERVWIKGLPNYIYLECISENGTTAETSPDFVQLITES